MFPAGIRTTRLVLRQFRFTDADENFAYTLHAEFARRLDPNTGGYTRRHAARWVAKGQSLDWSRSEPHWAIERDGAVVGGIALRKAWSTRTLSSTTSSPARTGTPAWIDGAFNGLSDLRCVFAKADLCDVDSWGVMEKIGSRREGVVQMYRAHRGRPVDDAYHGMLRDEWRANR